MLPFVATCAFHTLLFFRKVEDRFNEAGNKEKILQDRNRNLGRLFKIFEMLQSESNIEKEKIGEGSNTGRSLHN